VKGKNKHSSEDLKVSNELDDFEEVKLMVEFLMSGDDLKDELLEGSTMEYKCKL
jgi:hypothetical protein